MRILNFCAHTNKQSDSASGHAEGNRTHIEARGVAVENAGEVELLHLLLEPAGEAGVHARAAGEDDVFVELGADVDGCGLDGLEEHLCDAGLLDVDEVRLEHAFGGFEPLGSDFDYTPVRKLRNLSER